MNKKLTRLLCVVLALVMAFSLAACGKSKKDTTLANDPEAARYNPETYDDESAKVYEQVLGEFAKSRTSSASVMP